MFNVDLFKYIRFAVIKYLSFQPKKRSTMTNQISLFAQRYPVSVRNRRNSTLPWGYFWAFLFSQGGKGGLKKRQGPDTKRALSVQGRKDVNVI